MLTDDERRMLEAAQRQLETLMVIRNTSHMSFLFDRGDLTALVGTMSDLLSIVRRKASSGRGGEGR